MAFRVIPFEPLVWPVAAGIAIGAMLATGVLVCDL